MPKTNTTIRLPTDSSYHIPPNDKYNSKNTTSPLSLPRKPKTTSSFSTKVVRRLRNRWAPLTASSKINCCSTFSRARSTSAERGKICRSSKSAYTLLGRIIKSKLIIPAKNKQLISPTGRTSIGKTSRDISAKSPRQNAKGTPTKTRRHQKTHQRATITKAVWKTEVPKRRSRLLCLNRKQIRCSNWYLSTTHELTSTKKSLLGNPTTLFLSLLSIWKVQNRDRSVTPSILLLRSRRTILKVGYRFISTKKSRNITLRANSSNTKNF